MKNKLYTFKSILLFLSICTIYLFSLILLLLNLNVIELYEISILFSLLIFSLTLLIYSTFLKNKLIFLSALAIFLISLLEIVIIKFNLISGGIESVIWLNIVFQVAIFIINIILVIGISIHYNKIKKNNIIRLLAFENNEAIIVTYNYDDDNLKIELSKELKTKAKINYSNLNFSREKFVNYIVEEDRESFNEFLKTKKETILVVRFLEVVAKEIRYMTFKTGIKTETGITFSGLDTTNLQKALSKIEQMDRSKAVMLDNLDLGILELELVNKEDGDFVILYANKAFEKYLDSKKKFIINKNLKHVFLENQEELVKIFLEIINENIQKECEIKYNHINKWYRLVGYKSDANKLVVIFDDITNFKKQEEEQEYKIYHDPLTDLYNNRGLHRKLRTFVNSKKLICFYIDLVDFSWINNYYSMSFSDSILVLIAQELKNYFGMNAIISRYFTDHFVIILNEATDEEIRNALFFLKNTSGKTYGNERNDVSIRKNIGYAIYPEDTKDIKEVVFLANLAMKMSIETIGIEPFHYFPGLKEIKQEKIKNIEILKEAIINKQITVFFQKIIDVRNNEIVMVESLARWQKEDGSYVPPLTFINLAVESRIIKELEDLLISESLRKYSEIIKRDEYKKTKLSLNLTPSIFLNIETIDLLNKYIKFYNLTPEKIYIEISEETFVYNLEKCNHVIALYRENGFKISIDDFGSSYSSLSILNNIDYEVLKIDGKFILNCDLEKNQKIIEMIIKIASIDHKRVVAEGVETKGMVEYLKSVSCFVHQGYYFHFPENIIK